MFTLLMVLFVFLCFFLAVFVLIQQGKGDLGVGSLNGSQMLFGGSGGQGFFEKTTWIMGSMFILGALGLSIVKAKESKKSILDDVVAEKMVPAHHASKAGKVAANVVDLEKTADNTPLQQDVTQSTAAREKTA